MAAPDHLEHGADVVDLRPHLQGGRAAAAAAALFRRRRPSWLPPRSASLASSFLASCSGPGEGSGSGWG